MITERNPFKFGAVVDDPYFTDRTEELPRIKQFLDGPNHLILISPRRYGKSSLIRKAVRETGRLAVFINLQMAQTTTALAEVLLKTFLAAHPLQRLRVALKSFRVVPNISYNLERNEWEVSLGHSADGPKALEDVLTLMNEKSSADNRLIVVFDEFQEIAKYEAGTDKMLRAVMQLHENINYVFLGSEESMMTEIFEDVRSPFYHFGLLLHLNRIPYEDFHAFLTQHLRVLRGEDCEEDARKILAATKCHPYYTQQLASVFWDLCRYTGKNASVGQAVDALVLGKAAAYETIWAQLNPTRRIVLEELAQGRKLQDIRKFPSSTVYSAARRLKKDGFLVRDEEYDLEDPFFAEWIRRALEKAGGVEGVSGSAANFDFECS